MSIYIYILILVLNLGCLGQSEKSYHNESNRFQGKSGILVKHDNDTLNNRIQNLKQLSYIKDSSTYEITKQKIEIIRKKLEFEKLTIDSLAKIFEESLLNKIIPFWEGTEWSFEGHTSKPKLGKIACGYFVSTTLKDIGLNINRYELAQQSPLNEAKSLSINIEVKEISEQSKTDNISAIRKFLRPGIHFIGFDESHVGFILKKNNELYLIHSNYINAVGVEIEQLENSEVFNSYSKFYLAELSTNENLLNYWKKKKQIEIIKI